MGMQTAAAGSLDPRSLGHRQDRNAHDARRSARALSAATGVALMLVLIATDYATWIELNVAVVYSVPLVFAAVSRKPPVLWGMTAALLVATFLVYHLQIPYAPAPSLDTSTAGHGLGNPYLVDRLLAALTVLLTATILQAWLFSLRALELRDLAIEQNNAHLKAVNEELRRQREEISAQNAELDRRRREAEEISSRKTQMLASISHDIRTPLQSISLVAEVMRRTASSPSEARNTLVLAQRLQAHALAVAELLSEVIDLASFDQGKIVTHPSEFALDELLQEQCQRLLPQAEAKGLELRIARGLPPLQLRTDRAKLGRIVANLVGNAIKFTSTGGVTLSFALDDHHQVRIQVTDTGCGISPENLGRIFGDFSQEHPGVRSGSGWGLGLAICRRLAALLGGELRVRSKVGQGSTFEVVLPTRSPD